MSSSRLSRRFTRGVHHWIWPPDKWERLGTVADLVGPRSSVLDVGGRAHEMRGLLPSGTKCLSANIEDPCDLRIPVDRLPFSDGAVDAITSCDVLEHVPPEARAAHVAELVRVAAQRVVLCFPAWSPEKEAAERRLHAALAELDVQFDFLDEHLEHGLPRVEDVVAAATAAAPGARVEVQYQQGIDDRDQVLLDAVVAWKRRRVRPLLRFARAWLRRPPPRLVRIPDAESSRAYIVIDVDAARL